MRNRACSPSSKDSSTGARALGSATLCVRFLETLASCRDAIACGFDNFLQLESHARMRLLQAGFEPDYFAIRDARTLRKVTEDTEEIAILAAARLGRTRLIDNLRLSLNPATDWGMLATP